MPSPSPERASSKTIGLVRETKIVTLTAEPPKIRGCYGVSNPYILNGGIGIEIGLRGTSREEGGIGLQSEGIGEGFSVGSGSDMFS